MPLLHQLAGSSSSSSSSNSPVVLSVVLASLLAIASLVYYLSRRPPFPRNAPPLTKETWPVLGSMTFFTQRWDFFQRAAANSASGNFSFYAGQFPVVGLSGPEARRLFFEHKGLAFAEGYSALLAGAPEVRESNNPLADAHGGDGEFSAYFARRLVTMLKGPQLRKNLPYLLHDARASLDALAAQPAGITDPFDSIYRIVFQITMRTVACNEIADDPELLERCLRLFEDIEGAVTPLGVMFPWIPLPSKWKRTYKGAQLYMIFKKVIDNRKKHGRRDDDALQYLIDQGDSITEIITFVLGSLFAGQLNSGVNAAFILCYLANNAHWMSRVREEVVEIADKYCSDKSIPLRERLMRVPIEAWESEFAIIDLCLKDTIRLQLSGTAFRKNLSGQDIPINKDEVIPAGAYVSLAAGDMHYNPDIYSNPDEWDPERYLPERAEDKKQQYAWMGWGLARHPCLGVRFAKLENNIIVAMFLAYFDDVQLTDAAGKLLDKVPAVNPNNHTARKPDMKLYLKYRARQQAAA